MIFYVPNNEGIYCYVEQKSVTKDRKSSLKLTKNVDVAGRHGAMINLYKQYGFNSG